MADFERGLVIGKFWPPHLGHKYLIDTATARCNDVTVIVCDAPGQIPAAPVRAEWLREIHPTTRVLVVPDTVPDDDSAGWAAYTLQTLGYRPDAVFTSEDYGDPYAHFLGCTHVMVDRARQVVPISGTEVRANPLAAWDYLTPPVRAYYARRVCVLGAESTGTTTLSEALAAHYNTVWVAEYGRDYSVEKQARGESEWTSPEFLQIAREQLRQEDAAARQANRVLICDTDALATSIWHRRYMDGQRSPEVEALAATRHYDLYLLTNADIPFVQDGTRDGEHLRLWMHDLFDQELKELDRPYALISGTREERLAQAVRLIDPLLGLQK